VSVLAFSVEKTFDGADGGTLDDAITAGTAAAGLGEPCDGVAAGVGLEPPMLSLIVGGGGGASVC